MSDGRFGGSNSPKPTLVLIHLDREAWVWSPVQISDDVAVR
ncbi:MAG: hypothetical protein ACJ746_07730 [Bryobacteraceae bacterium]